MEKLKNMRFFILFVIYAVSVVGTATSEEEVRIKKGTFPFMAFVYYPDQIETTSTRFIRSAVLIRENWLVTSSLEEDIPLAFPVKTLVARLGAVAIDSNFTLNEDEDEQEREIIQIVRPYPDDFNSTQWWHTDISLLKTLLPFNMSSSVATITRRTHKFGSDENCFILFYSKRDQNERLLMQMFVELLPSSMEKCGEKFKNETMICASRNENNGNIDPNFCQGNSGGPLICNNELTGIQTYITDCAEPYLYQFLTAWDDLITCAIEEKCQEEKCAKICLHIYKDPPSSTTLKLEIKVENTEDALMQLVGYFNDTESDRDAIPTVTSTATTVKQFEEIETTKTTLTILIDEQVTTSTTVSPSVTHTSTTTEATTLVSPTTSITPETNEVTVDETTEFREESDRNVNVEAQQKPKRLHSDATQDALAIVNCFMYTLFILTCVI